MGDTVGMGGRGRDMRVVSRMSRVPPPSQTVPGAAREEGGPELGHALAITKGSTCLRLGKINDEGRLNPKSMLGEGVDD